VREFLVGGERSGAFASGATIHGQLKREKKGEKPRGKVSTVRLALDQPACNSAKDWKASPKKC